MNAEHSNYFFPGGVCGLGRMFMYLQMMDNITSSAPPPIDSRRKSLQWVNVCKVFGLLIQTIHEVHFDRLYFLAGVCGLGRMFMYLQMMESMTSSAPAPIDTRRMSLQVATSFIKHSYCQSIVFYYKGLQKS